MECNFCEMRGFGLVCFAFASPHTPSNQKKFYYSNRAAVGTGRRAMVLLLAGKAEAFEFVPKKKKVVRRRLAVVSVSFFFFV